MSHLQSQNQESSEDMRTVQTLALGLIELYELPLVTINTYLKELTDKQVAVHSMLLSERRKLEDLQNDAMLDALLADIATIKERLITISNIMVGLHRRVQFLQARAAIVGSAAASRSHSKQ